MRNVKSVTELKQLALQTGAVVNLGGRQFNTAGERMRPEPKPAPPPPVETAPEPPPPIQVPAPQVHLDMAAVADAQLRMGEMLARALASQPTPQAPVREWLFTVERDGNGLLTTIRATAQS